MSQKSNPKYIVNEATGTYKFSRVMSEDELLTLASNIAADKLKRLVTLSSPEACFKYLVPLIGYEERENFLVLYLDSQNQVIKQEVLFKGTVNAASVYPREVVKSCLKCNAASVIFAHNHPSGTPTPSQADITITKTLSDALKLINVEVLDHVIVTPTLYSSFQSRGLI